MSATLRIEVIRTAQRLSGYLPQWQALWVRTPAATPFQSPAWLTAWWRAFAPGELAAVIVHEGSRLVGVAPLYLEQSSGSMRLLPVGISISDYLDVLVDPDRREAVLVAIGIGALEVPGWQEWELPELEASAAALALPAPPGCTVSETAGLPCPVLELPRSEEAFIKSLSTRKRRSLRLIANRLRQRGDVTMLSAADREPQWWLSELWRLHSAGWSERGQPGVLVDQRLAGFHAEVLAQFRRQELSRTYALSIGGSIAGIYYGFLHRERAYGYLTGFDPAFSYYSPGTQVLRHAIAAAIAEGAREFHFLRGKEAYKYGWGPQDRWSRRRLIRRGTP